MLNLFNVQSNSENFKCECKRCKLTCEKTFITKVILCDESNVNVLEGF